ncbi:MAG: YjfB family protein [Lachnospiraceae bacterium]|nr:YjfB family protein [Lachnospiraceae bacterium]MDE6406008.1 YjfB family protein [Lachnospiraceae bacterium]MDE6601674.1 YjfB family protein [Lachnospiraceae bacterium]
MDIAGLSMAMSSAKTNDAFGVAMLAKSLDQAETTGSQVVGMMDAAAMELSVNPHIGGNFDMTV